jgi:hypothetical protein
MHSALWTHTSLESREIIERLPDYEEESQRKKNPYWLYAAMKKTHFLEPTGISLLDKKKLELEWCNFRMKEGDTLTSWIARRPAG